MSTNNAGNNWLGLRSPRPIVVIILVALLLGFIFLMGMAFDAALLRTTLIGVCVFALMEF